MQGCRVKKNNTIYVVWHQDPSGKRVVFVTKSTDGGNTFSKPLNISKNPGASQEPKLVLLLG
jgi:hypothetical protein